MESGIRENFACGIRNPESGIQLHESGISQYSIKDWNPESKSSTDKIYSVWNTESKPLLGRAYFQIYPGGGHWGIKRRQGRRPYSTLFSPMFSPRYE